MAESKQSHTRDVVKVRTFTQDVERLKAARGETTGNQKITKPSATPTAPTPVKTPPPVSPPKPTPPSPEPPVPPPTDVATEPIVVKPPTQNSTDGVPPFHFIRGSSPDETEVDTAADQSQQATADPAVTADIDVLELQQHKSSILTDEDEIFDIRSNQKDGSDGNIITDTKRKRFRLFPALVASIKGWFTKKQTDIQKARAPQSVVRDSKARQDVIRSAAERSAMAPRDDHAKIAARLREVERTATPSSVTIADKQTLPAPTWTHTVSETESPPVEASQPEPIVTPIAETQEVPTTPVEPAVTPTSITQTVATESTPTLVTPADNTATAEPPASTEPDRPARRFRPATTPVPARSPVALIAVIVIAIIAGVGTSIWWFGGFGSSDTVRSVSIPSVISATGQSPIVLSANRDEFLATLTDLHRASGEGVTQIYPTKLTPEGTVAAAPVQDILNTLALRAQGGFVRNITDIGFGSIDGQAPFIVLKTTSFDTSLSGMLNWEATMSADLAPFFGEPITRTFDQGARSNDQTSQAFFIDTLIANQDVRVLFDQAKDERLMYSFINRNTILITTTREAFMELVPLIK